MKENRHQAILNIIREHDVYTQEGILEKLGEAGFNVTQATVSRDIKKLNLIKVLTPDGKYRYTSQQEVRPAGEAGKFQTVFTEAVTDVDYALNTVVVKCHVGFADAACASLDMMPLDGVVGTIAGDDTIFVLMRSEAYAIQLVQEIQTILGR